LYVDPSGAEPGYFKGGPYEKVIIFLHDMYDGYAKAAEDRFEEDGVYGLVQNFKLVFPITTYSDIKWYDGLFTELNLG
jgi:hypothetical protein